MSSNDSALCALKAQTMQAQSVDITNVVLQERERERERESESESERERDCELMSVYECV